MIVSIGANVAKTARARDALPAPASAGRLFALGEHRVAVLTSVVAGA